MMKRQSWRLSVKKNFTNIVSRFAVRVDRDDDLSNSLVKFHGLSLKKLELLYDDILRNQDTVSDLCVLDEDYDGVSRGTTVKILKVEDSLDGNPNKQAYVVRVPKRKNVLRIDKSKVVLKARSQWTIDDVCKYYVKPRTSAEGVLFVDTIEPEHVGKPFGGAFVCQARKTQFGKLMEALRLQYGDRKPEEVFIWMDIFCVNQHKRDRSLMHDFIEHGLHVAIERFDERLIYFDNWVDPTPLKRAWCIWEIYGIVIAARHDNEDAPSNHLEVIADREGRATFLDQFLGSSSSFNSPPLSEQQQQQQQLQTPRRRYTEGAIDGTFIDVLNELNPNKLDAQEMSDLQMIRKSINKLPGQFGQVKRAVTEGLHQWFLEAIEDTIKRTKETESESYGELILGAGEFMDDMGEDDVALSYYVKAKTVFMNLEKKQRRKTSSQSSQKRATQLKQIVEILKHIGGIHRKKEAYDESIENYTEALNLLLEIFGDSSEGRKTIADCLQSIGLIYDLKGEFDKALAYYNDALNLKRKAMGLPEMAQKDPADSDDSDSDSDDEEKISREDPAIADLLSHIGAIYRNQGNYSKSLDFYKQSLKVYEKVHGKRHAKVAQTLSYLAMVYSLEKRYDRALEFYNASLSIYKFLKRRDKVAEAMNNIGSVHYSEKKLDKALQHYQESLKTYKEIHGLGHARVADTLNNIALAYSEQGKYDKAIQHYKQSLRVYEEIYGGNPHPTIVATLHNMAMMYKQQGNFGKAVEYGEKSLAMDKQLYGENHPKVADSLFKLSQLCHANGQYNQALDHANQANMIFQHFEQYIKK